MRTLFVVLDAVNYSYSHILNFKDFYKYECIANCNWTLPSIFSMITGLTTPELLLYSIKDKGKIWRAGMCFHTYRTIFDDYKISKKYSFLPILSKINVNTSKKEIIKQIEKDINVTVNEESLIIFIHLRGGHFVMGKHHFIHKTYEEELKFCYGEINPIIEKYREIFDNIVITSDHGSKTDLKKYKFPIGKHFDEETLHVPIWSSHPLTFQGEGILSSDNIFNILNMDKVIRTKDFVISAYPCFGRRNKVAISYEYEGNIIVKEVELNEILL